MTTYAQLSVSMDGYLAGPDPTLEAPLGRGGEQLHEWVTRLRSWRAQHGMDGGDDGPESTWVDEVAARTGAYVMGRKMFSGGSGPWADDPNANGWWGSEPPFHAPVFVVTHHAREPLALEGTTFHFVTEGVEEAHRLAVAAAAGRDVQIAGGASVVQQIAALGLLDELTIHTSPLELGGGTKLFVDRAPRLEQVEEQDTPHARHVRYRVVS